MTPRHPAPESLPPVREVQPRHPYPYDRGNDPQTRLVGRQRDGAYWDGPLTDDERSAFGGRVAVFDAGLSNYLRGAWPGLSPQSSEHGYRETSDVLNAEWWEVLVKNPHEGTLTCSERYREEAPSRTMAKQRRGDLFHEIVCDEHRAMLFERSAEAYVLDPECIRREPCDRLYHPMAWEVLLLDLLTTTTRRIRERYTLTRWVIGELEVPTVVDAGAPTRGRFFDGMTGVVMRDGAYAEVTALDFYADARARKLRILDKLREPGPNAKMLREAVLAIARLCHSGGFEETLNAIDEVLGIPSQGRPFGVFPHSNVMRAFCDYTQQMKQPWPSLGEVTLMRQVVYIGSRMPEGVSVGGQVSVEAFDAWQREQDGLRRWRG